MWRRLAAPLVLTAAFLAATPAHALLGDSKTDFGLDGSFRTLVAGIDEIPPGGGDITSNTLLRLVASGHPASWFFYEVHGVQSLSATSITEERLDHGPGFGGLGQSAQDIRYQAADLTWNWHSEEHVDAALWLDRGNVKFSMPFADVTLGRQAITFGKAYFWNPLDVYSPFDARQFDRDYKSGVDAARVDLPFNNFSGFNIVAVAGRTLNAQGTYVQGDELWNASWYGSSILGRLFTTYKGWDLAAQGGKVYAGYQAGVGTVGEIGPIQIRGEAAYFFSENPNEISLPIPGSISDNMLVAVAGVGHRFENTLDLEFEYLFNGGGDSKNFDLAFLRVVNGQILQLSKNMLGFNGTYEIMPILVARFGVLFSVTDSPSAQLLPGITWSMSDNADLLVGAMVNVGERPDGLSPGGLGIKSEFGSYPDLYYTQFKFYF